MTLGTYTISYAGYIVMLCALCGALLLLDAKQFASSSMEKEGKMSRVFGWVHLGIGTLLLIAALLF